MGVAVEDETVHAGAIDGVALQLVLLPLLIIVLTKTGLVPRRYPDKGVSS